jgi:hypothetical protein
MPHIDTLTKTQRADLEAYLEEGYSLADWLGDTAIQCQCCDKWFDNADDFDWHTRVYGDRQGRTWICEDCAPPAVDDDFACDVARGH